MRLKINGGASTLPDGATVARMLERLALGGRRVAVEVNRELIPAGEHAARVLRDGDEVEIVEAVGGG